MPVCKLLHELMNQLSVIVGRCDLAIEKIPVDSDCVGDLSIIREVASRLATGMQDHQCELTSLLRTTRIEKEKFIT